jgi:hypothetical protein
MMTEYSYCACPFQKYYKFVYLRKKRNKIAPEEQVIDPDAISLYSFVLLQTVSRIIQQQKNKREREGEKRK